MKEKKKEEKEVEMAAAAADDDQRQGAHGKRYIDHAIFCACSPFNLLSFAFSAGEEEGHEEGGGEEEEEEVVLVIAATPDKEGAREKTAVEKRALTAKWQTKNCEIFDIFYLHLPLTFNSTFIVFFPSLL